MNIPEEVKKKIIKCFENTTETRCFKCNKFRVAEKKWNFQLNYEKCKEIYEIYKK